MRSQIASLSNRGTWGLGATFTSSSHATKSSLANVDGKFSVWVLVWQRCARLSKARLSDDLTQRSSSKMAAPMGRTCKRVAYLPRTPVANFWVIIRFRELRACGMNAQAWPPQRSFEIRPFDCIERSNNHTLRAAILCPRARGTRSVACAVALSFGLSDAAPPSKAQ